MRKILNILLLLCLPLAVLGAEITQQQAKEKARAFMQQQQGRRALAHGSVTDQNMQPVEMGLQSLYAFNCEGGGYVIVSGDDSTTPVLGYSPDGALNVAEMPANLRTWLEGYADQIRRLQRGDGTPAVRRVSVGRAKIDPLVESRWNQRDPFPLAFPYTNMIGDEVIDVTTGEDVTQKIKFFSLDDNLPDCGLSKGEIHVKADDGHRGFCLLRVDPSLAGRTVRFTDGNIYVFLLQEGFSSYLSVFNSYCRQTKENVYVVEGNRYVLKQRCEIKPFTQYLEPAEELENPPAYFTIVDVDNPTGIDEVKGQKTDDVEIYYDLQGRRLNGTLQRGLYIKNGKKTIIK
jgi:hypothetical protein